MKIRLGALKRLIREVGRDTVMSPTQPAEASPESMRTMSHPSLAAQSPLDNKVNLVVKALTKMGKHVDARDVKKLLSTVDPQRLLILPPDQVAKAVAKRLAN